MAVKKRLVIVGVVVLCAMAGAIIGVIVAATSVSSSAEYIDPDDSASSTGEKTSDSTDSNSVTPIVTSDPTSATYSVVAFAIGDWNTTVNMDSRCSRAETYNNFDVVVEDVVASLKDVQCYVEDRQQSLQSQRALCQKRHEDIGSTFWKDLVPMYGCTDIPTNEAGGGIQKESASGLTTYAAEYVSIVWTYTGDEYGFFSLTASEEWPKLQYHTADDSWTFGSSMNKTTVGGMEIKHCWYVPVDGTKGEECSS